MKPAIFLLGGHDLEMLTIKELLSEKGYHRGKNLFDNQLSWGAKLSSYENIIAQNKNSIIYGIELVEDIPPPERYIAIDHHNSKDHLPSSLEQVAALLKIELNRDQKLVAANDSGYIPAMKAMGATKTEINDIRQKDREAQGVTPHDEELAKKAVSEKKVINGIIVVKSETSKFSPITDRLFGQQDELLIYTDNELCYFGTAKTKQLIKIYSSLVDDGIAFYGGRKSFFGIGNIKTTNTNIESYVKAISNLQ